ncbi:MAG: metallophosphoesterase [Methanolinea sp.]|nr:metallophosphoesterase [Methanolinea sp.]
MTGSHRSPRLLIMLRIIDPQLEGFFSFLAEKFGLHYPERHLLHLTLAGPFCLLGGEKNDPVRRAVEESSRGMSIVSCTLDEFTLLSGRVGKAVVQQVHPDCNLLALFSHLSSILLPHFSKATWIDRTPGARRFHITLGSGLSQDRAETILRELAGPTPSPGDDPRPDFLRNRVRPGWPLDLFRISIAKNGALWREYDLPRRKWLDRSGIYCREEWAATLAAFRVSMGYELTGPWSESSSGIFLIADLHLGHTNIIRYCRRPFPDAATMDRVLVRNWNFRVRPADRVFFLGDLAYGPGANTPEEYLSGLSGRIRFIRGNHDQEIPGMTGSEVLEYGGFLFFLVHDPSGVPPDFHGWVIYGHHHNNQIREFPFLDTGTRRVNVSSELIGYVPLLLDELLSLISAAPPGMKFSTLAEARARIPGINRPHPDQYA